MTRLEILRNSDAFERLVPLGIICANFRSSLEPLVHRDNVVPEGCNCLKVATAEPWNGGTLWAANLNFHYAKELPAWAIEKHPLRLGLD